ncbi:MAG: hypothetical protein HQ538_01905, partial [Parcubacteria group bacterium]|nr:hypothetical protein [Parcubacteria group bacterium]
SSAGSTVRGFEWLAPDSLKPSLSGIAQDIESNVDILAVENPTFLDNLTQGAGSTATFFIPGVGIAKGVSALGMTGKAALYFGGSLSTALEATSEAGGVYQELRDSGKSDEEASKAATETFWANAVVIGLTNHLGPFSDKIKSNLKRGIISSLTEGGQEGIQTIISNIETGKPVLEGVKDSVLIGAILGGPTGFVGGENLTGVDPNTMKRMIEENYTDGTPPEGTSGAVIKTDPIINPINFKEINKKVENNLAEEQVTINSIQLGDDFSVADKDVSTGRKSVTKQPVLLGRDETGIYVKDGNHRIAEAMRSGENNITATFNEQAYRKLTEDVKEIKEKVESILKKDAVKIEDFAEFGDKLIEKFPEADLGEGEIDFTKTDISEDIIERSTFNNEPSLEEIHSILREKPKPIKEQKAESEILEEFEIAEAGKRIQTDDRTKPIVQKSTFPQWIPSELRRKTLLNAVKQHILNNTVPIKVAEKRLYDITKKRIAEKSAPKDAKPKKKKVSEKEINVSKIQFEQISPTKQESKAGVSSGSYYASKGEFSPIDIPNHVTNIEMPEMISLYKTLLKGEVPFLRKFPSAWGAFYSDPNNPRIAISPKAFESEDSNQAVKTLAHEIGHLIDFLPDMNINKGNLLNRLESLVKIRKGIIGSEEVIKKRKNIMSNISKLNNIEKKEGGLDFNESKDRENAIENLNKINKE